jgi:hypothetical protein
MKVRFLESAVEFESYPFDPASVKSNPKVDAKEIVEINPHAAPPEIRTRDGEILFVSAEDRESLMEFARRNSIPEIERLDVWAAVLEPFLAASFTEIDNERTLKQLEAFGVYRDQVVKLRAEYGPLMKEYNALHQDWVHLGLFDLFEALREKGQLGAEIYQRALKLVTQTCPRVFYIHETPAECDLEILDRDLKLIAKVYRDRMAPKIFVCLLFIMASLGLGWLVIRHIPLSELGKTIAATAGLLVGFIGAIVLRPKGRYDIRIAGNEKMEHVILRSATPFSGGYRFVLTGSDGEPLGSTDEHRERPCSTYLDLAGGREYRLHDKRSNTMLCRLAPDSVRRNNYKLEIFGGEPLPYWAWAIILLC